MSNIVAVSRFKELGLTDEQAALAASWNSGVDRDKVKRAEELYATGIDVETIHQNFPEFGLAMLYQARALFGWDQVRRNRTAQLAQESIATSGQAQPQSLILANTIIAGLSTKYMRPMQIFITDPFRADFPSMTKSDMELWKLAVEVSRETMGLNNKAKDAASGNGSSPMIAINIVQGTPRKDEPHIIDITPERAAEIEYELLKDAGMLPDDESNE